jgi:hypothetical protein
MLEVTGANFAVDGLMLHPCLDFSWHRLPSFCVDHGFNFKGRFVFLHGVQVAMENQLPKRPNLAISTCAVQTTSCNRWCEATTCSMDVNKCCRKR